MEQWRLNFFIYMIDTYQKYTLKNINIKWRAQVEKVLKARKN